MYPKLLRMAYHRMLLNIFFKTIYFFKTSNLFHVKQIKYQAKIMFKLLRTNFGVNDRVTTND